MRIVKCDCEEGDNVGFLRIICELYYEENMNLGEKVVRFV